MKGSYSLIIEPPREAEIGALGVKEFEADIVVYNGSAFGPGGLKRVLRHFSSDKKIYWHIDYLLKEGELKKAIIFPEADLECKISEKMSRPVEGFGSSDCSCDSHLFQFGSLNEVFKAFDSVSHVKVLDKQRYDQYQQAENNEAFDDFIRDLPDAESYEQGGDLRS